MNSRMGTPLFILSLSDHTKIAGVIDVFKKLELTYIEVKDRKNYHIIFTVNGPLSKINRKSLNQGVELKLARFNTLIYKGYQLSRQNQSLMLTMPPAQLTYLAHCFKYGAYNHHRPESRGNLVYQSIERIYNCYNEELIAIYNYYRYLSDKKALAKMTYFAYESLVCTVAHKYRLTKKCARLKLNRHGFHSFSPLTYRLPHTGEPYTLKGVRTVLREVDSLLTTDPTTHHHLKKIFK
ncbi:Type II intron maturase [Halolactibacillus halophilus]|uniref:Type II intron maturase n=1 Tax=Halolactibacillus halophilus TaxID=306540 RepID=A0A1I5L201_9BACI|nr:group II intron reverse transcriptase/maturase [Halolactibacillus halophilus]GEM00590.1 hypothetical protein HHA03_01220 [Halolactibacillus halophilus]SFO90781.1 Type II intron maturase [Halolactibacillus halophilus]